MKIEQVPISSRNYAVSNKAKKGVVMHWMAGKMAGATARFKNPNSGVSAQYGIADDRVVQWVADKDIAYHVGVWGTNESYIGIEHEGGYEVNGKRVKPNKQTHDTSAQLLADLSRKHGWGKLVVGGNIFPHNHYKPTQCPGTLDLHYIVNKANSILENNKPMEFTGEDYITRICENYEILLAYPLEFVASRYKYIDGNFEWNGRDEDDGFRRFVKIWAKDNTKEAFKQAVEADYQTWLASK